MKRIMKIGALVVLALVIGVAALLAVTLMGRRPLRDGQEVNRIRVVADRFPSVAIIPIGEGQVALVEGLRAPAGRSRSCSPTIRRA